MSTTDMSTTMDHPHETESKVIFACDMTAIATEERTRHTETTRRLFQAVETIRDLPNGYSFQLPNSGESLLTAAEFVANERLCCPFFGFELHVAPGGGSPWLYLTGPEGVKPFIRAEIGGALQPAIAKNARFSP
jgi:hypothetical protein